MGLKLGFDVCWVCLVVGFGEDNDDDEEELVRTNGFRMNRDGNGRGSDGLKTWSVVVWWLFGVNIVFCPPSICVLGLEKSKNIIFSPWSREDIQNDVAQPVWASEHLKCLF